MLKKGSKKIMKRCKKVLSSVVACLMIVSLIVGGMTNPVKAEDKIVISELNVTVDFSKLSSVSVGAEIPDDIRYDEVNTSASETLNIDSQNVYFLAEGWWNKPQDGEWINTHNGSTIEEESHCQGVYDAECEYSFAYAVCTKEGYEFDPNLSLRSNNADVSIQDIVNQEYLIFRVELGTVGDIENNVPVVKEEQEAPTTITSGVDKINGTTAAMEYATSKDATEWTACTEGSTVVSAGTYYVRYKETETKKASSPFEVVIAEQVIENKKVDSIIDSKTKVGKVEGLESVYKTIVTDSNKGYTAADKAIVDAGGSSSIYLKASPISNETVGTKAISDILTTKGYSKGLLLDLSVIKEITDLNNNKTTVNLIELPDVIKVSLSIPQELQGKQSYSIYRYHEGKVDTLSTEKNQAGEYIELSKDGKTITLNIKYFSDYILGYKDNAKTITSVPETGDTISLTAVCGLMISSMIIIILYRKREVL